MKPNENGVGPASKPDTGLKDSLPLLNPEQSTALKSLWIALGVISLVFAKPLYDLIKLSIKSEFHSHIPLIPVITGYLIHLDRDRIPKQWNPSRGLAMGFAIAGAVIWLSYFLFGTRMHFEARQDALFWQMAGILPIWIAAALWITGRDLLLTFLFPVGFLAFMLPIPSGIEHVMATFLQHASADVANIFIEASRTPVLRKGLLFELPGISIVVAEECSGIRSSFVLFITSLIAGHLYLRNWGSKCILAAVVLPLALLRNGFRIFTLAMLTVHVDRALIDSAIHHRGGPIFFALSLIPFFGILWWLRKREATGRATPNN